MKKIFKLFLLTLTLCFTVPTVTHASEITKSNSDTESITVLDKNGELTEYELKENSTTEIPFYAEKEGSKTRAITKVATLTVYIGEGYMRFNFVPTTLVIAAKTKGFTGEITTYRGGIRYGHNSYKYKLSGRASAAKTGTGRMSGTYYVTGYKPAPYFKGYSW